MRKFPYYHAAQFKGEAEAGTAYQQIQELIYRVDCDLSSYRLFTKTGWQVAIIGERPSHELHKQIQSILATGTPVTLDDNALVALSERRKQEVQKGPWVEHNLNLHFTMKKKQRKQQKQSRKLNRRK